METNEILQQILDNQVETNKKIEALEANMEGRFAQVEERFVQIEERFEQVEERFAQMEKRLGQMEERIVQIEKRIVQMEKRIVQMEERFVLVDGRLDKVEEKIELLTSQTTQAYHDLVEIITNQKEDITQNFTPLVETAFWADKTLHLEKEIYPGASVRKTPNSEHEGKP
ncbi:hypothetical protein [Oceanobacillus jordanicus]|uniref:Uncharacterized protein n=1 Tax=Oceanobacillus jordanicus TaxID=2867266 RepID=A0AAW5B7R7_9BACI|nr:hypothetical protein [Oceanobacillus jordanicus]MCG3419457.1 hypothetical protein [Oceanobacillus jordanicus]